MISNTSLSDLAFGTGFAFQAGIMRFNAFVRYPKVTGATLALVSLVAGAVALEAADFGAPAWVFVPLLVWLVTLGLPSTVAVLLLAAVWGKVEPLHGFWLFCVVAVLLALGAEVLSVRAVAHVSGGSYEN